MCILPGVVHSADVPYVWGYPLLPRFEEVMADSQLYMAEELWKYEDRRFSEFIQILWTNFAKNG